LLQQKLKDIKTYVSGGEITRKRSWRYFAVSHENEPHGTIRTIDFAWELDPDNPGALITLTVL